jgi:outer membrane protein assembly factor BamB
MIFNRLVGEDGKDVRRLSEIPDYEHAYPAGPHRFHVGDFLVDTAANTVTKEYPDATLVRVDGKDEDYTLARLEPDGRTRWSVPMHGVRSVRGPDIAVGGGRTIATLSGSIYAFDDATGKEVWTQTTNVEGDRLMIAGDNVISTFCNEPRDHWLIANALSDGKERFRITLVDKCDPWVAVLDQRIYVVEGPPRETTLIFDLGGNQIAKLDEQVQAAKLMTWGTASRSSGVGTRVLLTDKRALAMDAAGTIVWRGPKPRNDFGGGADFAELPNGDLLLANYGAINDSGVDVMRLHRDGSVAWLSTAEPLGVTHSGYIHRAYIEVRGDKVFVISQGTYGDFLERMSVATGARELRCVAGMCTHPAAR